MAGVPTVFYDVVFISFEKRLSLWTWLDEKRVTMLMGMVIAGRIPRRSKICEEGACTCS